MAWIYSKKMMEGYANSRYSQEQGAESLEENFLDGEQCALWNGTHMQQASWLPGKMTDVCQLSRSGMTFKFLTDDLGEDLLMWFLEDFLAKTYPVQDAAQELKESDQGCGSTWQELSVRYDLDSHSWRTHLCLWDEALPWSSVILPKWGMMLDGVCWERQMLVRHTDETESGYLLPTPTCADATMGAVLNENTKLITLKSGRLRKISNQGVSGSIGLARHVAMWPTPQASDNRDRGNLGSGAIQRRKEKGKQIALSQSVSDTSGALNPLWVEWLMGWPLGWSDLKPLETARCQSALQRHGRSFVGWLDMNTNMLETSFQHDA